MMAWARCSLLWRQTSSAQHSANIRLFTKHGTLHA